MANTASAKKAIRSSKRKAVVNLRRKRAFKEARKEVKKAVASNDTTNASELLSKAYKQIDKAAKTNLIHKKAASRYKSRLAKSITQVK